MQPTYRITMENFQIAYVNAVAAQAGKNCDPPTRDLGIDMRVIDCIPDPDNPRGYEDGGPLFNCQLKASTRCKFENGNLLFPIKVKAYNKLVNWRGIGIKILIAFHMPTDIAQWLSQTSNVLCLRHCCYWTELTGQPRSPLNPDSTIRIPIPVGNIFDQRAVSTLTDRVRRDPYS